MTCLLLIDVGYAKGIIRVEQGLVEETAPDLANLLGMKIDLVQWWVAAKNGRITEVTPDEGMEP